MMHGELTDAELKNVVLKSARLKNDDAFDLMIVELVIAVLIAALIVMEYPLLPNQLQTTDLEKMLCIYSAKATIETVILQIVEKVI